jgi:hypothetical protein
MRVGVDEVQTGVLVQLLCSRIIHVLGQLVLLLNAPAVERVPRVLEEVRSHALLDSKVLGLFLSMDSFPCCRAALLAFSTRSSELWLLTSIVGHDLPQAAIHLRDL